MPSFGSNSNSLSIGGLNTRGTLDDVPVPASLLLAITHGALGLNDVPTVAAVTANNAIAYFLRFLENLSFIHSIPFFLHYTIGPIIEPI